jgi:hypothetical protein
MIDIFRSTSSYLENYDNYYIHNLLKMELLGYFDTSDNELLKNIKKLKIGKWV